MRNRELDKKIQEQKRNTEIHVRMHWENPYTNLKVRKLILKILDSWWKTQNNHCVLKLLVKNDTIEQIPKLLMFATILGRLYQISVSQTVYL